jgi:hypothetical protein
LLQDLLGGRIVETKPRRILCLSDRTKRRQPGDALENTDEQEGDQQRDGRGQQRHLAARAYAPDRRQIGQTESQRCDPTELPRPRWSERQEMTCYWLLQISLRTRTPVSPLVDAARSVSSPVVYTS